MILFTFAACGRSGQPSKDPSLETSGVGGGPYNGAEPSRMPPDSRPDGPLPEKNGQPMSSAETSLAIISLVSIDSANRAEPNQMGVGGFAGVGGAVGSGGARVIGSPSTAGTAG